MRKYGSFHIMAVFLLHKLNSCRGNTVYVMISFLTRKLRKFFWTNLFQIFKLRQENLVKTSDEYNILYVADKTYHFAFCYGFVIAMFLDVAIMQWIAV